MKVCSFPETVTVKEKGEIPPSKYPEWLKNIADFLGITPEQARTLIIGVVGLIGLAILISILK